MIPAVYNTAERLFPGKAPLDIVRKVAMSCSLLSIFGNYFTILLRCVMADATGRPRRWARAVASTNAHILEVIGDDLKVWPLYDLVCFGLIPPSLRPWCTYVASTCWAAYLSLVAKRAQRAARRA